MRWLIKLTPTDGKPVQATGKAGGICTARAHAAAAIAALARDTANSDAPLDITVITGRRTITLTAPPTALHDVHALIALLTGIHVTTRGDRRQ